MDSGFVEPEFVNSFCDPQKMFFFCCGENQFEFHHLKKTYYSVFSNKTKVLHVARTDCMFQLCLVQKSRHINGKQKLYNGSSATYKMHWRTQNDDSENARLAKTLCSFICFRFPFASSWGTIVNMVNIVTLCHFHFFSGGFSPQLPAMLPFSHGTWRLVGPAEIAQHVSAQEGHALGTNEQQTFRWWSEMGSVEHFPLQLNTHTIICPNL